MPAATSFDSHTVESLELDSGGPRRNPIEGSPVEALASLYTGDNVRTGIWEVTPGAFPVERNGQTSIMYIIQGAGVLRDDDGTEHVIEPGAVLIEPDNYRGEWHVTETVRKFYVMSDTPSD